MLVKQTFQVVKPTIPGVEHNQNQQWKFGDISDVVKYVPSKKRWKTQGTVFCRIGYFYIFVCYQSTWMVIHCFLFLFFASVMMWKCEFFIDIFLSWLIHFNKCHKTILSIFYPHIPYTQFAQNEGFAWRIQKTNTRLRRRLDAIFTLLKRSNSLKNSLFNLYLQNRLVCKITITLDPWTICWQIWFYGKSKLQCTKYKIPQI